MPFFYYETDPTSRNDATIPDNATTGYICAMCDSVYGQGMDAYECESIYGQEPCPIANEDTIDEGFIFPHVDEGFMPASRLGDCLLCEQPIPDSEVPGTAYFAAIVYR